nr:GNAT family N-acetyltransferase [Enterococcus sp. JM4C]
MEKLIIQSLGIDCGVLIYQLGVPNLVEYFCLLPDFSGRGVGSTAWQLFEQGQTGIWRLETPDYSKRNHHFYQKRV